MVAPRICPRLDRHKTIVAVPITQRAARAGKIGVDRGPVIVAVVKVASRRVGLPDLDQSMWHWTSIFIEHAPGYDDAFAKRLPRVLTRQVVVSFTDVVMPVNRPCRSE